MVITFCIFVHILPLGVAAVTVNVLFKSEAVECQRAFNNLISVNMKYGAVSAQSIGCGLTD